MKVVLAILLTTIIASAQAPSSTQLVDAELIRVEQIRVRMAELRGQFQELQRQLDELRLAILQIRSLDPAKFTVNWTTGKVVSVQTTPPATAPPDEEAQE